MLDWRIAFTPSDLRDMTAVVEVSIEEGGCGGPAVYTDELFTAGGTAPAMPRTLSSGTYGFRARAVSPSCTVVGEVCNEISLPADSAEIVLEVRNDGAGAMACVGRQICRGDGTCMTPALMDGEVVACEGDGTPCDDGAGTCHGGTCCFGCWDGSACQLGSTNQACGSGGAACSMCAAGEACVDSSCEAVTTDAEFDLSVNAAFLRLPDGRFYSAGDTAGSAGMLQVLCAPRTTPSGDNFGAYTGPLRFADIAMSQYNGCGITLGEGKLWCWGRNRGGILGVGDPDSARLEDEPVEASPLLSFRSIDAGDGHACGITLSDALYCWGSNDNGQLGIVGLTAAASPTEVAPGTQWRQVSTSYNHTCGIRSNGGLSCWGENDFSQLGDGGTAQASVPTAVGGFLDWTWISAGVGHTCGIRGSGASATLWCWGRNTGGEAGQMPPAPVGMPTQVTGGGWRQVACGQYHTCALVDVSGATRAFCFGFGLSGELGRGESFTTTEVPGPTNGPAMGWTSISSSWEYSCGVADGNYYCWGNPDVTLFHEPTFKTIVHEPTEVVLE